MADREKYQDYEGAWGERVPEAEIGSFENDGVWGTHLRWSRAGEHAPKPESAEDDGSVATDGEPTR